MRSIYWKELRENFKWALLGFIFFTVELAYTWVSLRNDGVLRYGGWGEFYQSICHQVFQMVLLFTPVVMAAILSFLQIKLERSRDRWAFLVHRPVPLSAIFWGKALAGTTIYIFSVLIPYIGLCWWASVPGHCPSPFYWGMAIPGALSILNGLVLYFTILLIQMRPAKLWGSRIIPLLAALSMTRFLTTSQKWSPVLYWEIAALVVMVAAALDCFVLLDRNFRLRWLTAGALMLVLYAGFLELLQWPTDASRVIGGSNYEYDYYDYWILENGQILKFHGRRFNQEAADLDGNTVDISDKEKFESQRIPITGLCQKNSWNLLENRYEYRRFNHWFAATCSGFSNDLWFYNSRKGYFIYYKQPNMLPEGYLSGAGYSHTLPSPADSLKETLWNEEQDFYKEQRVLFFESSIYWLNLKKHELTQIFKNQDGDKLIGCGTITGRDLNDLEKQMVVVVTRNEPAIHLLGIDGKPILTTSWHTDRTKYDSLQLGLTDDQKRIYLRYEPNASVAGWDKRPIYIVEMDRTGKVLRKIEVPQNIPISGDRKLIWSQAIELYWGRYSQKNLPTEIYGKSVLCWRAFSGDKDALDAWKWHVKHPWKGFQDVIITSIIGLVCAGLGYWRMSVYKFSRMRRRLWAIGIFLFGPAVLLTMLAFEEWPLREKCPVCGKQRQVTRESCEHCGAKWPQAQKDGTELITV
jgi:ABC-type transport system involved in multi-copper enzyme maturation permease subunit